MRKLNKVIILLLALLLCAVSSHILAEEGASTVAKKGTPSQIAAIGETVNQTLVNVGQVAMWAYAGGNCSAYPNGGSTGGMYFPRGSNPKTWVMFTDGIIWGGIVNDGVEPAIRVGGQAFSNGTVAGAMTAKGVSEDINDNTNVNRIWRIRKDYSTVKDDALKQDAAEMLDILATEVTSGDISDLRALYRRDWADWPAEKGAPFYDVNGDGVYTPEFYVDDKGVEHPKKRPDKDLNGDGEIDWVNDFDPAIHGDEPGYANGDQVVWSVSNDLNETATVGLYGSPPIGMEQQLTLWAYRRADALGNVIFKQFKIIYKGRDDTPNNATIDSVYFCQWADPDLGAGGDDFVGCDTTLSLGYVYNATSTDGQFAPNGLPPAASGFDFFAGPAVPDAGSEAIIGLKRIPGYRNLPMTSFSFFASGQTDSDPDNNGPYQGTLQFWNLLRGFKPRPESPPEPWVNNEGNVTKFRVAGDPVTGTGDIDSNQGDRRMLQVAGPFSMALGDTAEMVVAAIAALGSDRLSSVAVLKFFDRTAQDAFDNLFVLPSPPPTPPLTATAFNGKIFLEWGSDQDGVNAVETSNEKGYLFEGYNIYALPNAGATADQGIRLSTIDLVNEVTVITQEAFDQTSGQILDLPVQLGNNTGISRSMLIERDVFREAPLANGTPYYFGISAYSYNPDPEAVVKTLESPLSVVVVVPQDVKPGVRNAAATGDTIEVAHSGPSNGTVTVIVTDPTKLTGDQYKVNFETDSHGETVWNLLNVTKNSVALSGMTNQSGDDDYLFIDGMQVIVAGPPPGVKPDDAFTTDDTSLWGWDIPQGTRRFTWAGGADGFGLEGFQGAIGWGSPESFFGVEDPYPATELKPVRLVLARVANDAGEYDITAPYDPNDPNVSYGYRYGRGFAADPAKPEFEPFMVNREGGYSYQGFEKSVPLAAYDISDPENPRRLVVGHLENNAANGLVDGKYFPGNHAEYDNIDGGGPREWLWIYDADYSETANPAYEGDAIETPMPIMYFITVGNRSGQPWSPDSTGEDQFDIYPTVPNSSVDEFVFTSDAPSYSASLAKEDIKLINVFPNPYYAMHRNESDYFDRFVTFNHLPERAVIRIFTLSGNLVRTIEKDSPGQFQEWDMQNENGLPAGSGIYFVHIDMPDIGAEKQLKLALIREQQYLRRY